MANSGGFLRGLCFVGAKLIYYALFVIIIIAVINIQPTQLVPKLPTFYNSATRKIPNLMEMSDMWKGPFANESRIYVSTETFHPSTEQEAAEFFERAQLLWHLNPKALREKELRFGKSLSIPITKEFKETGKLYAYAFVQAPANISPHPNVLDPHMAYYTQTLMSIPVSTLNRDTDGFSVIPGPSMVSFSIGLRSIDSDVGDNTILSQSVLPKPQIVPAKNIFKTFGDMIIANERGKSWGGCYDYETIKIDFEVENVPIDAGHKTADSPYGQINMFVSIKTMVRDLTIEDPRDPTQSLKRIYKSTITSDQFPKGRFFHDDLEPIASLSSIFGWILVLFYLKINIKFWFGPNSRTVGVSRVMVVLFVLECFVDLLHKSYADGFFDISFWFIVSICATYVMTSHLGLSILPWKAVDQILDTTSVEAASNAQSQLQQNIAEVISARNKVDRTVATWVKQYLVPVAAHLILLVLCIRYSIPDSFAEALPNAVILCGVVLGEMLWILQIAINYRCKVGNNTPVSIHVLNVLFGMLSANKKSVGPFDTLLRVIGFTTQTALIVQGYWYRKIKHE